MGKKTAFERYKKVVTSEDCITQLKSVVCDFNIRHKEKVCTQEKDMETK